jgi:hypothetical protein
MRRPGRLIFSALLFFPYFSPFPGIFLVIWRRLALPRLRRRLKGKKGVNRHASPYRLKNYVFKSQLESDKSKIAHRISPYSVCTPVDDSTHWA